MQGVYYQEAKAMKSLKMQTHSRNKRRTKLYGPVNIYVPCSAVLRCQRKFAYIRDSSKPGTKVALMHGSYYQEAMAMKSLKMQTLSRCKRRTKL